VSRPDLAPPKLADFIEPLACERFVDERSPQHTPRTVRVAELPHASAANEVAAIYRKHRQLVYRLALRYGKGNVAWAEDIMQEVFIDLLKALPSLDNRDDLAGWLYRATTNRCLWRMRRERFLSLAPVRWVLGERQSEPRAPDELAIARDDLRCAMEVLSSLPSKEQVAFCMYYLDGKEQEEIGEVLGHSKSYVCKLIQRAVQALEKAGWEVSS
jgi:RNA polymerase sigma-70 factor, ECF subfamily